MVGLLALVTASIFLAQRSTSMSPSTRRGFVWMIRTLLRSGGLPTNVGSQCRLLSRWSRHSLAEPPGRLPMARYGLSEW